MHNKVQLRKDKRKGGALATEWSKTPESNTRERVKTFHFAYISAPSRQAVLSVKWQHYTPKMSLSLGKGKQNA